MAQYGASGQGGAHATPVATISAGIVITGNVECSGELQISGRIEGDVRCATVFVDASGVVEGAIEAERLRVCGSVNGTTRAGDLAVEAGGTVVGETSYERLKVAAGGIIGGAFTHNPRVQGREDEKPLKLVEQTDSANPRRVYVD